MVYYNIFLILVTHPNQLLKLIKSSLYIINKWHKSHYVNTSKKTSLNIHYYKKNKTEINVITVYYLNG